MDNNQKIVLKLDASYKIKHEKYKSFETSFFKKVYKQAAENVKEIIDTTKTDHANEKWRGDVKSGEYTEPISSLIAFDGKRGSGKTSAMLSFCDFLRDFNRYERGEYKGVCDDLLKLNKEVSFTVLECIDATLVTDSEELMGAILGKMLTAIEKREGSNSERSQSPSMEVRRLKTRLGEIYCSLKAQDIVRDDTSPGEVLEQLSRSWNQQGAFRESVQKFNEYMSEKEDGKRQNYLVIPIDDVDMNLQSCYELLEAVRKYMMVPNVIVLLAADDEQLETICVKSYYDGIGKEGGLALAQKLALEYLEKLIPSGRRIYMPDLYREENFYRKPVCIMQGDDNDSVQTAKDAILLNVWKHVGIILNKDDENTHWLQPHSLRKLSNYVNSMRFLSETKEDEEGRDVFYKNINWFYEDLIKRYFNELKGQYSEVDRDRKANKVLREFENAVLGDKLQRLAEGLTEYGFNPKNELDLSKTIYSYGDWLSIVYLGKSKQKFSGIWQALSFVLSLQMRRLIFSDEDEQEQKRQQEKKEQQEQTYERVMMFSKGDFWGKSDLEQLKVSGKSQVGYETECEISIDQLLKGAKQNMPSLDMPSLLLLALQLGLEENKEGKDKEKKYKGYFKFGNFVNGILDYQNRISRIKDMLKKEEELRDKEKDIETAAEKLCGWFDGWQRNYKTTRVIPFDSAEFMFAVFDKLYGDHGVFGTFGKAEDYVQMYQEALKAISDILDSYDKYYCGIRDEYKTDGATAKMNELKTEYKVIFDKCPFVACMGKRETSEEISKETSEEILREISEETSKDIITRYISLFNRAEMTKTSTNASGTNTAATMGA